MSIVMTVDLELATRCRTDDDAFAQLYRQHARRLFGLLFRMTGSAEDVEDLLQEVFLQAHRKLPLFRGESTLGTWLYRLAMNHCLDHLKGKRARMARATESLDREGAAEPAIPEPVLPTAISRMDLERAIDTLPERCKAAFLLHDVEGFDHREVANILGISEGTSKSQVHKARMKLRVILR